MQVHIDPVTAGLIKERWAALDPTMRQRIEPMLAHAHQAAVEASKSETAPPFDPKVAHQALLAQTVLNNDRDDVLKSLAPGIVIDTNDGGEILGTGKYQLLDPGWADSLAAWLGTLLTGPHAFNSTVPATIPIDDDVTIAMAGDWGTGDYRGDESSAAIKVGKQIANLRPAITIHLGDVYYSGSKDQERQLLVKLWPRGAMGTFALNSNHEMYSGSSPYFNETLADPDFALQKKTSFFALENQNWVIVALDSAYFSDAAGLYRTGRLKAPNGPSVQLDFLKSQAAKGKKLILLTHHNGLAQDGKTAEPMWAEVLSAFPNSGAPDYWYWAHVHSGAVYNPFQQVKTKGRCCGHGALPAADAPIMDNPQVAWFERRKANDPDIPQRILNGFALVHLTGSNIQETFYDENGGIARQV